MMTGTLFAADPMRTLSVHVHSVVARMREVLNRVCALLVAAWIALPAGIALPEPGVSCSPDPCERRFDLHVSGVLGLVALGGTAAVAALWRGRHR